MTIEHLPDSSAPIIAACNLSVGYGEVPFVRDLDITIHAGEIVALLGANGAGKTTALLGLAGVLRPLAGRVVYDGEIVTSPLYSRARKGLALITQERCVFMGLTVLENLRVGGCDPDAVIEQFPELGQHLRRTVGLLSGGQQQMLAVARAIARRPKVLLADELSAGLAPVIVDRILRALAIACARDGLGVLMVEQQVAKALRFAHRGAILRRGRLEMAGQSSDLLSKIDEVKALYL